MRDYGTIMRCRKCEWRGPFYLMLVPTKYPGTPRCPSCGKDDPIIESQPAVAAYTKGGHETDPDRPERAPKSGSQSEKRSDTWKRAN